MTGTVHAGQPLFATSEIEGLETEHAPALEGPITVVNARDGINKPLEREIAGMDQQVTSTVAPLRAGTAENATILRDGTIGLARGADGLPAGSLSDSANLRIANLETAGNLIQPNGFTAGQVELDNTSNPGITTTANVLTA